MAFKIPRPLDSPSWFTFFLEPFEALLNKVDRQNVKFLRKDITKADAGTTISLGAIPANAVVLPAQSGVYVHEVFNAGTNNRLDIGTAANTALYGTDISLLALGFFPLDETGVAYRPSETVMTELKFVVDVTGVAATTGKASIIVAYAVYP